MESGLFGNVLVFRCFRRKLDASLANWEAWEDRSEEAGHIGGLRGIVGKKRKSSGKLGKGSLSVGGSEYCPSYPRPVCTKVCRGEYLR